MPDLPETDLRDEVLLQRTLAATPETVWQLWTEPEHFAAWYGPGGATVTVDVMDVQVGGERRVSMRVDTPAGEQVMHFAGAHTAVEPARHLAYTEAVVAGPDAPLADNATEVQVRLEPVSGGTQLTLRHIGIPAGSPGEMGWTMALDKLERRLSDS